MCIYVNIYLYIYIYLFIYIYIQDVVHHGTMSVIRSFESSQDISFSWAEGGLGRRKSTIRFEKGGMIWHHSC